MDLWFYLLTLLVSLLFRVMRNICDALQDLSTTQDIYLNGPVDIRFGKYDEVWLSPAFNAAYLYSTGTSSSSSFSTDAAASPSNSTSDKITSTCSINAAVDVAYIGFMVPTCYLHTDRAKVLMDTLEAIFLNKDAKPHWGKYHRLPRDEDTLKKRYPLLPSFRQLRRQLDPKQLFLPCKLRELFW
jgi:FAD/FMN-containing dehydrogenase